MSQAQASRDVDPHIVPGECGVSSVGAAKRMAPTREVAPMRMGAAKGEEGESRKSGEGVNPWGTPTCNQFASLRHDEHDEHDTTPVALRGCTQDPARVETVTVAGQQQRQRSSLVALRGCTQNAARFATKAESLG